MNSWRRMRRNNFSSPRIICQLNIHWHTLLCTSAPYDMIQHFLHGSRNSVWPDCRPPIRRDGGRERESPGGYPPCRIDGVLLAAQRHGGAFCALFAKIPPPPKKPRASRPGLSVHFIRYPSSAPGMGWVSFSGSTPSRSIPVSSSSVKKR